MLIRTFIGIILCCASFANAQVTPQFVRVSESAMRKRITHRVNPHCPSGASRIEGQVVLKATIDKTGKVENLQAISGHPMLLPAAIEAVKQWTYKPFLVNGDAMIVETQITLDFHCSAPITPQGVVGDQPGGIAPSNGSTEPIPAAHPLPRRFRIAPSYAGSRLTHKVSPEYPPQAKAQHIEGTVVLTIVVDRHGSVANVQLISGHPALAPAAIDAVKRWKYEPYLLNDKPVEIETQVEVTFSLKP